MTIIRCAIVSLFIGLLTGCVNIRDSGEKIRFDREPETHVDQVDEATLRLRFPLCLKTAPTLLRLTNEPLKDGLRRAIWTRLNGESSNGSWYIYKRDTGAPTAWDPVGVEDIYKIKGRNYRIFIQMFWPETYKSITIPLPFLDGLGDLTGNEERRREVPSNIGLHKFAPCPVN